MVYFFQVLMVVMMLVECTHQAMVVIIYLVEMMYASNLLWLITSIVVLAIRLIYHHFVMLKCRLEVALTHQCTLVVVLVEAVIWVQVVLAHTIEVICHIVLYYCVSLFVNINEIGEECIIMCPRAHPSHYYFLPGDICFSKTWHLLFCSLRGHW